MIFNRLFNIQNENLKKDATTHNLNEKRWRETKQDIFLKNYQTLVTAIGYSWYKF